MNLVILQSLTPCDEYLVRSSLMHLNEDPSYSYLRTLSRL